MYWYSGKKGINALLMNILIVSALGLLLRFKMVYNISFVNHVYLLNGHSHFAFIGWIGLALIYYLIKGVSDKAELPVGFKKRFLGLYQANAWLMLISFLIFGYKSWTFFFLTVNLIQNIWFAVLWLRIRRQLVAGLFRFTTDKALFFLVLSSLGPIALAWMMATGYHPGFALQNAVYVYLHYQYNGWFIFSCLSILSSMSGRDEFQAWDAVALNLYTVFVFLGISLLLLFNDKPTFVVILNFINAAMLLGAFWGLVRLVMRQGAALYHASGRFAQRLLELSFLAFGLKMMLQVVSSVPYISYLVYVHRAIAIGYLHLVFLLVVSFFLLAVMLKDLAIPEKYQRVGWLFIGGAIGNELVLALQGASAIFHFKVPNSNVILLVCAAAMFVGLLVWNISRFAQKGTGVLEEKL